MLIEASESQKVLHDSTEANVPRGQAQNQSERWLWVGVGWGLRGDVCNRQKALMAWNWSVTYHTCENLTGQSPCEVVSLGECSSVTFKRL